MGKREMNPSCYFNITTLGKEQLTMDYKGCGLGTSFTNDNEKGKIK